MATDVSFTKTVSPLTLVLAFAAIYVVWGSTYLAIRLAMETLPAFGMIGLRFLVAGLLMLAWAGLRGATRPTARQLLWSASIGVMLLFGGTGAVVWATHHLDSGLVALLVAMEPLWLAVLMMLWPGVDARPNAATWAALALGFAGAALLAAPGDVLGASGVHLPSLFVLMLGSMSWAGGSLISRNADLPASQEVNSGTQMLAGGLVLTLASTLSGEWHAFDPQAVSGVSLAAFLYLIVFGSLVAFSAYAWLIRTVSPTLVATHTYVNPVVAIFLGWLIVDETVGPRTLLAAALILGSVVIMTGNEARRSSRRRAAEKLARANAMGPEADAVLERA